MDPSSVSTLPSPSPSIKDLRQSCNGPSSPEVSELAGLVTAYKLSPKQAMQTSCAAAAAAAAAMNTTTSSNSQGNRQFATDIASIQNNQRSFMPSQSQDDSTWSSMQTQSSNDDLEQHYTFHSSPNTNGYSHRNVSGQSSPRSGDSPSYYPPAASWQTSMGDGSLQPPSFSSRECVSAPKGNINYYYSSAPFPSLSTHFSSQSFDGSEATNLSIRSHPDPYRDHYNSPPSETAASMVENGQSSPCGSSMVFRTNDDILSPGPPPSEEPGDDFSGGNQFMHDISSRNINNVKEESTAGSPKSNSSSHKRDGSGGLSPINLSIMKTGQNASTTEEPYAQLIYRAFMSTKPKYAMTLQDIYQWFRENTDKGKSDNKGWQNSIRHNLSMNQAFTKIERRSSTSNGHGSDDTKDKTAPTQITLSSSDTNSNSASADNKKSTKWYLEPWAITEGVQSTTRYRKGNASRRGGVNSRGGVSSSLTSSNSDAARRSAAYAAVRAASGRKGGIRRFKARQEAIRLQQQQQQHQTANGIQLHQYHHPQQLQFQSLQQQHQRQRQHHLMRDLMNGQYATSSSTTTTPNMTYLPAMTLPPGMDFDFSSTASSTTNNSSAATDPQLTGYPPGHGHQNSQHQQYQRAPSEPTIDEPLTPEPATYHTLKGGEPPSHLLPLHRITGLGSTTSAGTPSTLTGSNGGGAFHHYSLHNPSASFGVGVGVYDEVADRYGQTPGHGHSASWNGGSTTGGVGGHGGGGGVPAGVHVDGIPYGSY